MKARDSFCGCVLVMASFAACQPGARPGSAAAAAPETRGYVEELFAGRFPGVRVFRLSNGALSFEIRGRSTIYGGTQPLFVIDGVPVESESGMLFLTPSEIQRIEVLKDVGSTAAYGVRGANGVVLITTASYPAPRP